MPGPVGRGRGQPEKDLPFWGQLPAGRKNGGSPPASCRWTYTGMTKWLMASARGASMRGHYGLTRFGINMVDVKYDRLERIQRLTYYLGIGMAVTLFILLLVAVVPNLVQSTDYDTRTDGEILEMFTTHPAYLAMYERFPNATEEFESHGHGGGSLRVGVMDFEDGTQLILYMNSHGRNVYANVECIGGDEGPGRAVDGLFAAEYIRITDCLGPAT